MRRAPESRPAGEAADLTTALHSYPFLACPPERYRALLRLSQGDRPQGQGCQSRSGRKAGLSGRSGQAAIHRRVAQGCLLSPGTQAGSAEVIRCAPLPLRPPWPRRACACRSELSGGLCLCIAGLTAAAGPHTPSSGASRGVCLGEEDRRRAADCEEERRLPGKAHLQVRRSR